MSKITMQDIADALGTSRVTVWKTFNHRAGVSDEMKEKILEKAHELGYDKFSSEQYLPEPSKAFTVWHRNFPYLMSISCILMFLPRVHQNMSFRSC